MSRLSSFLYNMVHRFGYTKSRRGVEKELPDRNESRSKPDTSMTEKCVAIAEEVARQMELGSSRGKNVEVGYQTGVRQPKVSPLAHPVAEDGREGTTGKAGGGNDSPTPRLRFQKIQDERNEPVRERKNEWKAFGEGFLIKLGNVKMNLWMAGFREWSKSESQFSEEPSDETDGRGKRGKSPEGLEKNQEPGINVPIWEINPKIADTDNVPETIARSFYQETSFRERHRVVILLSSKEPDRERIKEVGRHLSETNVQRVLMGGPYMLDLMMEYPSAILDKCTQITFLMAVDEMTEDIKARLSVIQNEMQSATSIPINLEFYVRPEGKSPTRGVEAGTVIHQSTKPALPEPENRKHLSLPGNVPTVRQVNVGEETYPAVHQKNEPYGAERNFMSQKSVPAGPVFRTVVPLSSGASDWQMEDVQPPTEKQIVHAKNLLGRLGFDTKVVDEKYRHLGVASSYFGRPLDEWFLFMDRKKMSFLIDTLKKIEAEELRRRREMEVSRQNQPPKSQFAGSHPVGSDYPTQSSSLHGGVPSRSVVTGMPSETHGANAPAASHPRERQIQNSYPAGGYPTGQAVAQPVGVYHPAQASIPQERDLSQTFPADQPTATVRPTPQALKQLETMTALEPTSNESPDPRMTEATPTGMGMNEAAMGEREKEGRVPQVRPFPSGSGMTR